MLDPFAGSGSTLIAMGEVMVTGSTAAGSEILPACPISCCSSSVALRTLVCISVRFAIVPCVLIIWMIPDITMEETIRKIAKAVIISIMVKPFCRFLFMGT